MMENIFEELKSTIDDGGFTDSIIKELDLTYKPSKNTYRIPTAVACIAIGMMAAVFIGSVDPDILINKYEKISEEISRNSDFENNENGIDLTDQ